MYDAPDGRTDRARAADIDRLGERLLRRQQAFDLTLSVQQGAAVPVAVPGDALDRVVAAERERRLNHMQLAPKDVPMEQMLKDLIHSRTTPDPRSREQYLEEVDRYLEALRRALPKTLPEVAALVAPRIALRLHNHTHIHLKDVQVRLELPDSVLALNPTDPDDLDRKKPFPSGLPRAPRPYGPVTQKPYAGVPAPPWLPSLRDVMPISLPSRWEIETEGSTVIFPAEDVRVGLAEDLAPFVVVIEQPLVGTLQVPWTATATNMEGTAQGTVALPVSPVQSLFDLIELADSATSDGEDENDDSED
ncbi:hypothetical protein ACIGW7_38335 [Streptomyces sp. NPDC053253]|uniref:hypothetical protein n=1 Tax=Streptomyces sp. NPDC053253 TaxID=3365699 RepID=UPI0037D81388